MYGGMHRGGRNDGTSCDHVLPRRPLSEGQTSHELSGNVKRCTKNKTYTTSKYHYVRKFKDGFHIISSMNTQTILTFPDRVVLYTMRICESLHPAVKCGAQGPKSIWVGLNGVKTRVIGFSKARRGAVDRCILIGRVRRWDIRDPGGAHEGPG